jgi:hypothetical protein
LEPHHERWRWWQTNGKTPLLCVLFFSCLPWLTIVFYLFLFLSRTDPLRR